MVSQDAPRLPSLETCSEDDLRNCFRLLLGRNPGSEEWKWHAWHAGKPLRDVVALYLSSRECRERFTEDAVGDLEEVSVHDFRMYVSRRDQMVGALILRDGNYEPHVTEALRRRLRPGDHFVDIGANIGYYTLLAARLVGPSGRVRAFEPFERNVRLLLANVLLNRLENVDIFPMALADRQCLLGYFNVGSNGTISELSNAEDVLRAAAIVPAARMDDTLSGISRLDAIKIDVEGAEFLALEAGAALLRRFRPEIFSEFSPKSLQEVSRVAPGDYLRFLILDKGYALAVLETDGTVTECGLDVERVLGRFEAAGVDHIDVLATPGLRRLADEHPRPE